MTLDQLKYFLEAAKFQHVGKAAQSVSISPSAVSSAISTLEKRYGCQLFEKQGKGIRLTEQGQYLKTQVEKIFDDLLSIETSLGTERPSITGAYRIGASHFLSARFLAPAWIELQKKHPKVVGELRSMNTADLVSDIVSGTMDFGLCFSPLRHPDLKHYNLHKGQLRLAVRKGHPLLSIPAKHLWDELTKYPAVTHKAAPGVDICESHEVFDRYGIIPKMTCFFDSDEIAGQCLQQSDSWALLPDIVIQSLQKTILPLNLPRDWHAPYTISAVVRSHRTGNQALNLFRELVEQRIRKSI